MAMRRLSPTGTTVSRILAALMVLCMVGLAGAQPNSGSSRSGRRSSSRETKKVEKSPEIVPLAAHADGSTSQTSVTQGVVVRPSSTEPVNLDTTMPLSLNQVPLDQLVRFMADTTGKTVIKQRDLNTQISVNAPKPVTRREALELIYSALQLDNIYVAEQDDMLMLINFQSIKNIHLESIPSTVDIQTMPDSLRIVQKIYKFDNVNPSAMRAHLDMFMPNTVMSIEPQSNTLIITDQVKRIKAYDKIIRALDTQAQDKVLDVYKLNSANAVELAQLVRSLVQSGALADSNGTSETVIRPSRAGNDILMIPDPRLNWIIALCPKDQKSALDQLVAAFDVNKTDDYIVQIYKIEKSDASQLTSLLNNVISNKGLAASTAGTSGKKSALPVSGKSSKLWKRLAAQLGNSGGPVGKPAQSGDVLLIPEYRLNWIIAIMRPDLKAQMDDLVKQFDVEKKLDIQPRVLMLKTANANAIYGTVYQLVAGIPMSNPRDYIRIMPSQDNSSLIVLASDSNFKLVQELVDKVQTMPENRMVQIYKLNTADASQLSMILQAIISNRGLKGDTVATLGNWGQPGDVLLYPEYRKNWLIAILRPDLKPQLDELIKQFDSDTVNDIQARSLELQSNNALALTITVQRLLSAMPVNSARDYATIMPSDDGKKLIVMSSEAKFKVVQDLVKTVETVPTDKVMQVYPMKHADVVQMASFINNVLTTKGKYKSSVGAAAGGDSEGRGMGYYLRRMMESGGAANGGDLLMIPETRLNQLVAIMKPEIKPELDALIQQFDVESTQEIKPRMLDLKGANAAQVTATITRLLMGRSFNTPKDMIQVMPSDDGKQLIVMSTETNYKIVQEMVETVAVVPASKTITVYKLVNAESEQLITLLNSMLATKGISTSSGGSAAMSSGGSSGEEGRGFRYLRRMMSGGGNATGVSGDVLMIPETRLNWIIAITKPEVKPELDTLVKQFDVERDKDVQTRLLDLKGASAASVFAMVDRITNDLNMDNPRNTKDYVRVFPSEDNKKLVVISNAENYKMIEEMVGTLAVIPGEKTVEVYKIVNADAAQVAATVNTIIASKGKLTSSISGGAPPSSGGGEESGRSRFMRRMMMMGAMGGANSNADILMIPDTRLNWIFAIVTATAKPEMEALIKQLDVKSSQDMQTRMLDLKGANAAQVAGTVTRLLAGRQTENPKDMIQVMPSDDGKKLIVMSNEANYQIVEDMVATVAVVPTNKEINVYKLVYADASELITMLNSILTTKNISVSSAGAAPASASSSGSSSSHGFRYLRQMMAQGALSSGGTGSGDVLLIPDPRLNWIIAITKPEVKPELEALVKQFDVDKIKDVQTRMLDLKGANAATVSGTINNLIMGMITTAAADPKNFIRVLPSDDNKKLIVLSSEANYQMIEEMAATVAVMPADRTVSTYKLVYADAAQLISLINSILSTKGVSCSASGAAPTTPGSSSGSSDSSSFKYMRRMMMAGASGATGASPASDVILVPETRLNWIVAMTKPELKAQLDALVQQFDVKSSTESQPRLLDLKGANAAQVAGTVTRLLAGRVSTNPQDAIQVMPSDDGKKLIVMASEANYQIVEDMVATVAVVPTNKEINVYKLVYADASQLISMINSILTTKNISVSSAGAAPVMPTASSSSGSSDSSGFRYLRRMMATSAMSSGSGSPTASGDVLLIPDPRLNWIIAITKPEVKPELEALVKQFDVDKIKDVQTRMLDLKGASATAVSGTINSLIMGMMASTTADPKNFIRVLPSDDNKKLIVLSSEANFQMIEEMAATVAVMPADRTVSTYKLVYADAAQLISLINSILSTKGVSCSASGATPVLPGSSSSSSSGISDSSSFKYMRRMMTAGASGATGASPASDVIMIPEARLNWIIALTKPELKAQLDALVQQFDVESSRELQARLLPIKTVTAQAMATMVNNLLSAQQTPGPGMGTGATRTGGTAQGVIRVMATDDNQKLIVMSSEADYKVVEDLVQTLDAIPDDRVVDTYKLKFADASELTMLLQSVILKSPLMKGSPNATASASTGNLYSRYSRYFGGSYGSSSYGSGSYGSSGYGSSGGYGGSSATGPAAASGSVQIGNIILIPDTRLNWIIVICPKDQKAELDKLILQFDIEKPKDQQARVIELKHSDANDLAQTLNMTLREQTAAGRREAVRVSATDDGSKLLVWSTEANFKDIQKMVQDLDVETPKDVQARMIDVQYAEATQLATTINNLFRDQYFGSGNKREYVRISATEDGMRLMVMSSEANFKMIEDMIKKLDTKDAESQVTKVYKVEHLEAQDMADQLTRLFEERNRTNMSNGGMFDSYSGYGGYGRSRNSSTQAPTPAIVPSPRNNTVMVMARPKDMEFLEQMVKELDVPIDPQTFEPRIYHIRNTDASEVVNVMQNLFSGTGGRATQTTNYYFDSWRPNRNSQDKDAIEAVFGKLRFVVDQQTNTIVVLSSNPKNYEIIDSVIEKLDQADPENSEVLVYDLKYADALKIANQVNYLFSMGQTQRPNTPQPSNNGSSNNNNNRDNNNGNTDTINELQDEQVQDFVPLWGTAGNQLTSNRPGDAQRPINTMIGNVRVVPDVRSNKLMVAAPPVYFPTINKLIESLDHNEPQVYISTRILELTRGKERRIGIRWTPDPNSIEPGELDGALLALNQLGYIDTFGHGDQPDPTKTGVAAISRTFPPFGGSGSKTVAQTLKNGNSVISSDVNIALLIQLLVKNSESRIFTEPGVTVNNNETGNIFFGSEYPFQNSVQNTDNGNQNIGVSYRPVGINLDIRPHINSNDEIVLKAAVENSNVRSELVNGQLIKDMRRFTTEVSLKNGETMVIGGILTDDGEHTKRGVPILGDLPLLKYIFGKKDETQFMRELVFFVTPQIVETPEDSRAILSKTNQEIKSIEDLDPKKMESLRKYEDVPNPNGNATGNINGSVNGNGTSRDSDNGSLNVTPSSSRSFQLHRRSEDVPQVINLSDDDKQAALKALKEVEYESRQPGFQQSSSRPAGTRLTSPRAASLPDERTTDNRTLDNRTPYNRTPDNRTMPDNKPFVMGLPAQTHLIEENGSARTAK